MDWVCERVGGARTQQRLTAAPRVLLGLAIRSEAFELRSLDRRPSAAIEITTSYC